jgi:hypothetical protein
MSVGTREISHAAVIVFDTSTIASTINPMLPIASGSAHSCMVMFTCNTVIPEKPTKLNSAGAISGAQRYRKDR